MFLNLYLRLENRIESVISVTCSKLRDLITKADLIYDQLGRLFKDIAEVIPTLDELMSEAILRVEKVIETESSFREKR